MNTKTFTIGFTAMDSIISSISAAKRGVVHAVESVAHGAQTSVRATKSGARNTSEAVTSFFAGAKQAIAYRRGTCKRLEYKQEG